MLQNCAEPRLEDLLRDSPARMLMASDGVEEHRLRALLETVKRSRENLPN